MTNLATYSQIARLVKSWADKIDNAAGVEYAIVGETAEEMRAFSNGLQVAVETFGPLIAELDHVVAAHNVVLGNEPGATLPIPVTEEEYRNIPERKCKQRRLHGPHYWRMDGTYSCPGNKPLIPEEV